MNKHNNWFDLLLAHLDILALSIILGALVILFVGILQGCRVNQCSTIGTTRCKGSQVEVCSSDHQWHHLSDCADLGGTCKMEIVTDSSLYREGGIHEIAICVPKDSTDSTN